MNYKSSFFGEDRNKDAPLSGDQQKLFENYDYNTDLKDKETKRPLIGGPVDDNLEDVDLTKEFEHEGQKSPNGTPGQASKAPASREPASPGQASQTPAPSGGSLSKSLEAAAQPGSDARRSSSESRPAGEEKRAIIDSGAAPKEQGSRTDSRNPRHSISKNSQIRDDGSEDLPERGIADSAQKDSGALVPGSAEDSE
jgi:hypothetical protein